MRRGLQLLAAAILLSACSGGTDLPWSDDFSTAGSWQTESDSGAQLGVQDGAMRIYIATNDLLAWAFAGQNLQDFHLRVEATQFAGPDNNEYGVLVRMQDHGNFYRFSVSGDGYYLVSRFVNGQRELLGPDWTPSEAIRQGQATNVLEVICQGDRLTFLVNSQQLTRVEDGLYGRGDIGLYAGSFYEGGVEVHFDNLSVTAP